MAENPFYRLAPFIQEFIYAQNWEKLRPVQVKAIRALLDTPNHVLITSGTASGKTEAAFLPILTQLYENPSSTIGVMYIGPLKALINDQFERLQALLDETHIPVQSWHGDVAQSKKEKFLKRAQGILQITPESLEAMVINRNTDLGRLFGDLRFVIIDEVHAFIDSDRGRQILCLLQRIARYQAVPPRRVGLSATIGEPQMAMDWLAGGTDVPVELITDEGKGRSVSLALEHYLYTPDDFEEVKRQATPEQMEYLDEIEAQQEGLFKHMYAMSQQELKTLIFANSRSEVEEIVSSLRRLSDDGGAVTYHAHHGSVSAPLRETAESEMRDPERPACTTATVTLELGIDLGKLDQVLQLNATHSVASFVQRLGRSGRRDGKAAQMFFYTREEAPLDDATLGKHIPWTLLQTIAIIQLYLEEKWIEPPHIPQYPFSLLYHQTMSIILATTELNPAELAERVLTLPPFKEVTPDQYRDLLRHLIEIKHLERTEIGGLIIGLQGERVVNNFRFYATFADEIEYQVRDHSREIGTIQAAPAVGDTIALAGYSWRVTDINAEKRIIYVEQVKGRAEKLWVGGGSLLHTRILQRMRQVLAENSDYGYLLPQALHRLRQARDLARQTGLVELPILPLGGNRYMLLPWVGTRTYDTLAYMLEKHLEIKGGDRPFYMEVDCLDGNVAAVQQILQVSLPNLRTAEEIAASLQRHVLEQNKYDRFVPDHLLQQAMAADYLDPVGASEALNNLAEITSRT
ncbi:MAG: DEAD/DEAH box helicase [Chloroflexi bacterium]|nr:DEAD/DEAH box helicase [Chloroflexota bacterium]